MRVTLNPKPHINPKPGVWDVLYTDSIVHRSSQTHGPEEASVSAADILPASIRHSAGTSGGGIRGRAGFMGAEGEGGEGEGGA